MSYHVSVLLFQLLPMQFAGQTLHITFFTDATISTQWTRSGLYFLLLQQRFCVSRYGLETVIHATKVQTLNIELDLMNWNFWPFKINMTNWTELSVILFFSSGTLLHSLQLHLPLLHCLRVVYWDMWCMIALTTTCTMDNHPKTQQNVSRWGHNKYHLHSWFIQLFYWKAHWFWFFSTSLYAAVSPQSPL